MRIVLLLAAIVVLAWLGFELRGRYRDLAQVCFGVSVVLAVLLLGALFGMYRA